MQIKSIKKQRNGFYKIIGDKEYILADDLILKHNILFKKEVDDEILTSLLKENTKYEVLNKVIKYISVKMRSRVEIDNYLKKYLLSKSDYQFIIDKLISLNLINDLVFADSYVYDHFYLTSDGPNKIKRDLIKHKIEINIIDKKIDDLKNEVYSKLENLVKKKLKTNHKYSKNQFKQKLEIYFYNLGYDTLMVDEIFENNYVSNNESDLLEKEYHKLYNKYVNKLDSYKLSVTLKQKLYQKGFEVEKINEIIDKKN